MQGSLIFVVIVAVWAAYLVQHWVRRRENAAATRSVDGFSEAMRVLQKRPFRRGTQLAEAPPGAYAVTPAPDGRATVEVRRALPVGPGRAGSPLTARTPRGASAITVISGNSSRFDRTIASTTAGTVPNQPELAKVEPMPENRRPNHDPDGRPGPNVPSTSPSTSPSMGQRWLRAALLLVAVLWVPASIALAATNMLTWLSVPFAVLTVAAVLVWLRTEAAADRARRLAARGGDGAAGSVGSAGSPPAADDTQAVHTRVYATVSGGVSEAAPHTAADAVVGAAGSTTAREATVGATKAAEPAEPAEPAAAVSPQTPTRRRQVASFFDGEAATAMANGFDGTPTASERPAARAEPPAPGTWSPVPVPRPTYAMKAKAEPRLTESGIPADVFATPEFADEADELDERALFARRAVSG